MLNVETFVSEILQSLCLQGIAEESGGDEGALHTYSCLLLELIDNLLKSN